jgi:DNA-binding transcriptional ArsR family regulator
MTTPDALNHPVRRQILRILIDSGGARSASELIAAGLPDTSVSVIAYHARVLVDAGMVSRDGAASEESTDRFATDATDAPEVIALLESTRENDVADA